MSKVVFITGASKGFGKLWTEALLKRGDKVAGTARDLSDLDDLKSKYNDQILPVKLDVNSRAEVFAVVEKVEKHFGKIDVLINNAGFGVFGATEETTEKQARDQMETNFFGSLWVVQAVLPIMRKQKSGHIIQISSFLGLTTMPLLGLYNASKFAVEGLIETVGKETAHLGIKTTLIEPNGYSTDWAGASAVHTPSEIEDYGPVWEGFKETGENPDFAGDPEATVEPMLNVIDNEEPPKRLLFGKVAYHILSDVYKKRQEEVEAWKEVSIAAQGK